MPAKKKKASLGPNTYDGCYSQTRMTDVALVIVRVEVFHRILHENPLAPNPSRAIYGQDKERLPLGQIKQDEILIKI